MSEFSDRKNLPTSPKPPVSRTALKERSIRSGAITLAEQALVFTIHFISTVILARLLTPDDYGLIAMVTAITGFASLFREWGLSSATIQSRDITHDQLRGLHWINVSLGALITVIVACSGPLLAWFYGKPQLTAVTAGIALTSVVSSIGTQHGALLSRQMRFGALAVIRIVSQALGLALAIIIALSGGGYWALVANSLATTACHSLGLWKASGFRPGRFHIGTNLRSFVSFGANIVGFDIVNYFDRNLDNVLIGRAWGSEQLGLYDKAYSMLMMPISNLRGPLHRVAFPALSRLQDVPKTFREFFLKYCSLLAFISMPVVTFLYICSENIIRVVLGPRWMGAVELFKILALVSFIQPVTGLPGTLLVTLGRGRRYFRWGLFTATVKVIAFFCGLPWGARGVAIGYCIATYAILHPSLLYALHKSPVRVSDFYSSILRPFFASVVMYIASALALGLIGEAPDALILALLLPGATIVYIAMFSLTPGGKGALRGYWQYLSVVWKAKQS